MVNLVPGKLPITSKSNVKNVQDVRVPDLQNVVVLKRHRRLYKMNERIEMTQANH